MRISHLTWLVLILVVGTGLYMLKYKVQDLEHDLVAKQAQIQRDRAAVRVLQAEWTYLNDPKRLRRLSEEFLGFQAASPQNVSSLDALPARAIGAQEEKPAQVNASAAKPDVRAEIPAPRHQSMLAVAFARLQHLLAPSPAGAATPAKGSRP